MAWRRSQYCLAVTAINVAVVLMLVPGGGCTKGKKVAQGNPITNLAPDDKKPPIKEVAAPEQKKPPIEQAANPDKDKPPIEQAANPDNDKPPIKQAANPAKDKPPIKEVAEPAKDKPVAVDDGFVPLFNGKDLEGWKPAPPAFGKPGDWRVVDGVLIGSAPGGGNLASTRDDYKDCHLRVQARRTGDSTCGIWCRANSARHGYLATFNRIGCIWLASKLGGENFGDSLPIPETDWFDLECIVQGKRVQVKVNGKLTTDFLDERQNAPRGAILLTQLGGSAIEFRKIEIKELNAARTRF